MASTQLYTLLVTRIIPLLLAPFALTMVALSRKPRATFTQVAAFAVLWLSVFSLVFNFGRPKGMTPFQLLDGRNFNLLFFYVNLVVLFLGYIVIGIFGLVWRARKDTGTIKSNWVREGIFGLFLYLVGVKIGLSLAMALGLLLAAAFLKEWWSAGLGTLLAAAIAILEIAPYLSHQDPFTISRGMAFIGVSGVIVILALQILSLLPSQHTTSSLLNANSPERTDFNSPTIAPQTTPSEVSLSTLVRTFFVLGTLIAVLAVLVEANVRVSTHRITNCIIIRSLFLLPALPFFYSVLSLLGVSGEKRIALTIKGTMIWFLIFLGLGIWALS